MLPSSSKRREIAAILQKHFGWELLPKGRSKETFMKKPGRRKLRVFNQHNGDIDVSGLTELLRRAEITHEEWNNARKK